MSLFKHKKTVYLLDGIQVPARTTGAKRTVQASKKWYARVRFEDGKLKNIPLSSDKKAAQVMYSELLRKIEHRKSGILTSADEQAQEPLKPLLDAYERHLKAKGNVATYVELAVSRLESIRQGCRFAMPKDIDAEKFMAWLEKKTIQDDISQQTQAYYRSHLKSFVRWLLKGGKLSRDPLASVEVSSTITTRTNIRREFEPEEFQALLSISRESKESYRGLDVPDRIGVPLRV